MSSAAHLTTSAASPLGEGLRSKPGARSQAARRRELDPGPTASAENFVLLGFFVLRRLLPVSQVCPLTAELSARYSSTQHLQRMTRSSAGEDRLPEGLAPNQDGSP
eukprot:750456-Hanusia_phi.AAC.2